MLLTLVVESLVVNITVTWLEKGTFQVVRKQIATELGSVSLTSIQPARNGGRE